MALILSSSKVLKDGEYEPTPWHLEGITKDDYEMAIECGLLNSSNINDLNDHEYYTMIEKEEEFINDFNNDINIVKHAWDGSSYNCEYIFNNKIYENVDVRVIIKKSNFAIGTIDGNNNVYIPGGLINNITIGEIVKMNLKYNPIGQNTWKCIYVHQKEPPLIVDQFISLNDNNECDFVTQTFNIPKQDVGKMVGKNGICIQKILNDIVYRNNELKEVFKMKDEKNVDMSQDSIPKFDINNIDNYTEVKVWDKPLNRKQINSKFSPINDIFMKLYC
jgi:hypothetical protein